MSVGRRHECYTNAVNRKQYRKPNPNAIARNDCRTIPVVHVKVAEIIFGRSLIFITIPNAISVYNTNMYLEYMYEHEYNYLQ